jgi:hypothetical protein
MLPEHRGASRATKDDAGLEGTRSNLAMPTLHIVFRTEVGEGAKTTGGQPARVWVQELLGNFNIGPATESTDRLIRLPASL